jgi:O-antigen/teichoic acid export membrane protein
VLLAGSVASKAMRFATDVILGRVLGPAAFGVVAAAMSVTFILTAAAQLGVDRGVLRFGSVHESAGLTDTSRRLARRALMIPVGLGLVLTALVAAFREPLARWLFRGEIDPWVLVAFTAGVPVLGFLTVLQSAARAARRYRVDTLVGEVVRNGLILVLTAVLLLAGWRLWGAAAGFTGGMLLSCGVGWWLYGLGAGRRRRTAASPAQPTPASSGEGFRALLRVSLPLALVSSAGLLINELDKVMLAMLREPAEAGLYNAAFRLARQVNLLLPSLMASLSPWIAPLIAQARLGDLRDLYRRVNRWATAVAASAVLISVVFARELLTLFGPAFAEAAPTLSLVALGQFALAASAGAAIILQLSGHERVELRIQTLALALNVALNLALIPRFGAEGAAAATLAVHAGASGLRLREARRVVGVLPWDRGTVRMLGGALGAAAAGAALGLAARAIGAPVGAVVAAAAAGGLAGWAVFIALGGLDAGDAALLRIPRLGRSAAEAMRPASAVIADVPGMGSRRAAEHAAGRARRRAGNRERPRRRSTGKDG